MTDVFENLRARISQISVIKRVGRVVELAGGTLRVAGLSTGTGLGDRVVIRGQGCTIGGRFPVFPRQG